MRKKALLHKAIERVEKRKRRIAKKLLVDNHFEEGGRKILY